MKKENSISTFFLLIASIATVQLMGCDSVHVSTQAEYEKNIGEIRSLRKSLEMYKKDIAHSNKLLKESRENLKSCLEPRGSLQACLDGADRFFSEAWDMECKNIGLKNNCTLPRNVSRVKENYRAKLKK